MESRTSTSVNPALIARCAPRVLGTRAEYRTEGTRAARFHTSSASAICGTLRGLTKLVASIRRAPEPTDPSLVITNGPTSAVEPTWVPPQSSRDQGPPISTTRTSSS